METLNAVIVKANGTSKKINYSNWLNENKYQLIDICEIIQTDNFKIIVTDFLKIDQINEVATNLISFFDKKFKDNLTGDVIFLRK